MPFAVRILATRVFALAGLVALASLRAQAAPIPEAELAAMPHGKLVYETYCVGCHGTSESRAPVASVLRGMNADQVLKAMNEGPMKDQAAPLSDDDRRAVAEFLTDKKLGSVQRSANLPACADNDFDESKTTAVRDWGFDLHNSRYQTLAQAGLAPGDMGRLEVAWVFVVPDAIQVRSQPTFAGGWLFMGSQDGTVYALDAKTGCRHWTFQALSEVRTTIGIATAEGEGAQRLAVFGDRIGNVYALNAQNGTLLWKVRPSSHPNTQITGSPRVVDGRIYVPLSSHEDTSAARDDYSCCTSSGGVAALELKSGRTVWLSRTIAELPIARAKNAKGTQQFGPSGASVWNSPVIDQARNRLYVGTGDNYSAPATGTSDAVIAMDLDTGAHLWAHQATEGGDIWNTACLANINGSNCPKDLGPDFDIGAGTILGRDRNGRSVLLVGQKSGDAFALDPDTGKLLWKVPLGRGGVQGGIHFGMAAADGVAFVPVSDMNFALDVIKYEREPRPGLFALDLSNGKELWAWEPTEDTCRGREFCDRGIAAAPTVIGDHVIVGALDGILRVHERATGKVVWSMDTTVSMRGFNGIEGHGGSMNAIGPVAHDGMVYVASGYAFAAHMPGNILMALKPKACGESAAKVVE
jgi:polyvinyl alcohol dehydrogenase (cytochrome)